MNEDEALADERLIWRARCQSALLSAQRSASTVSTESTAKSGL